MLSTPRSRTCTTVSLGALSSTAFFGQPERFSRHDLLRLARQTERV
eukprot:SAG31_NODE_14437_length_806_cov_1.988685_1_plen_45_part_01